MPVFFEARGERWFRHAVPYLRTYFVSVRDSGNLACGNALTHSAQIIVHDVEASDIFAGKKSGRICATPTFARYNPFRSSVTPDT